MGYSSYDYYGYSSLDTSDVATSAAFGAFQPSSPALVNNFHIAIICKTTKTSEIIKKIPKKAPKAGEEGWKAIIPIYNLVILYKISGVSPWLLLIFLASFIPVIGSIAVLVLHIYQTHQFSKSFGKDVGYTIGLIFLPVIFYMILGFGSAEYVGPGGKNAEVSTTDAE